MGQRIQGEYTINLSTEKGQENLYILSIIAKSDGIYPLSDFMALLMLALEELEKLEADQDGFLIEPIEFETTEKDGKIDLNLFVHRGKNIKLAEKLIGKVAKI